MPNPIDRTGQRFGRLVAKSYSHTEKGHQHWNCLCDCGKWTIVPNGNLQSGHTRSCGCLMSEESRARFTTHGANVGGKKSRPPEYNVWCDMRNRCMNPNNGAYPHYGGRGIVVCDRWLNGEDGVTAFACFLADMGPRPSAKHSIERKDNDGPYAPWNCVWATKHEQLQNQQKTIRVLVAGKWVSLTEAARIHGVLVDMAWQRRLRGLPESEWFKPPMKKGRSRRAPPVAP